MSMTFLRLAAVSMVLATPGLAQDVPAEVRARQGLMQLNQLHAGTLFAMVQGKRDYDAEVAKTAAANIVLQASIDQRLLWPEGTDAEALPGATRALPAIWQNYPDIEEKAKAWLAAAQSVEAVAGNGLEALQGAIGPLGGACKACHDDYRASRN
jgi:cytochrome c556